MTTMFLRTAILLLAFATIRGTVSAQTDPPAPDRPDEARPISIGLIGWGTMNLHRGDFTSYDGILECGTFDEARTIGWGAGYLAEFPLGRSFSLSPRFYYWQGDGDFTTPNPNPTRIAVDEQTVVPLETEHTLETALDYVMADILVKWNFASPFYLAVGPSVGYNARAAYEQEERIISPQGVTFLNGDAARNIIAGNFDEQGTLNTNRQFRLAATGMLGGEIPLNDRLMLTPEAGFSFGLTSVLSSFDWSVHAIRAGLGLQYALGGERNPKPDTIRIAPPDLPDPQPLLTMETFNQQNGVRLNYAEVSIAEERGTDLIPLLPYVFFEPNSSTIPARYHRLNASGTGTFSEEGVNDSTLGVYHDLLNIIGSRMRRYPESTITVTGCREPLDDTEGADPLSAARARVVKEYLTGTWGINPERIALKSRVLPQEISNRSVADGKEENRRAEIGSNDSRILAPVVRKIGGIRLEPEAVVISPEAQFGEAIADWRLTITSAEGKELWRTAGTGSPERELLWNLSPEMIDDLAPRGSTSGTLTAEMIATTRDGKSIRAKRDIPVRRTFSSRRYSGEIVRDSLIERYSLIFFDFDTPKISDFNNDAIEVIRNRMRTNSAVTITGLTDRIGEEGYNRTLSEKRAAATSRDIQSRIIPEKLRTEGAGETFIYNNDLPEGRMYNRTVIVEIATPVEGI